VDPS